MPVGFESGFVCALPDQDSRAESDALAVRVVHVKSHHKPHGIIEFSKFMETLRTNHVNYFMFLFCLVFSRRGLHSFLILRLLETFSRCKISADPSRRFKLLIIAQINISIHGLQLPVASRLPYHAQPMEVKSAFLVYPNPRGDKCEVIDVFQRLEKLTFLSDIIM